TLRRLEENMRQATSFSKHAARSSKGIRCRSARARKRSPPTRARDPARIATRRVATILLLHPWTSAPRCVSGARLSQRPAGASRAEADRNRAVGPSCVSVEACIELDERAVEGALAGLVRVSDGDRAHAGRVEERRIVLVVHESVEDDNAGDVSFANAPREGAR